MRLAPIITAPILSIGMAALAQPGGCIDPSLIDPDALCPGIFAPVCGCDGITYTNACVASTSAGVTTWTDGDCGSLDLIPPVLDIPADVVVECGDVLPFPDITATDNSGFVTLTSTTEEFPGPCSNEYALVHTYVATDPSGNSTTGTWTITVVDDTPPIWVVPPADQTIGCTDPFEAESAMFAWASSMAGGSAFDACGAVSYGNDFDAIPLIDCTETVTVTVGFFAMDACGNQQWTTATLTITPQVVEIEPCTDVAGIDFGPCDAILGYAQVEGYCTELSGCGTDVGFTDYGPAFHPTLEACVTECNDGCISQEYLDLGILVDCLDLLEPVCGCDGITYSNACQAQFYGGNVSWTDGNCIPAPGCTYPGACNYDPAANADDGSCLFPPLDCPFPPDFPGGGCLYATAENFHPSAAWDDGSCTFPPCDEGCPEDVNGDGTVTVSDILLLLGQFGLVCG